MKKYVKPELFFESFELSQQIAACHFDHDNTLADKLTPDCRFYGDEDDPRFAGKVIFVGYCGTDGSFSAENMYCYHNSTDAYFGIFNS